jgi:hypothetical protein
MKKENQKFTDTSTQNPSEPKRKNQARIKKEKQSSPAPTKTPPAEKK